MLWTSTHFNLDFNFHFDLTNFQSNFYLCFDLIEVKVKVDVKFSQCLRSSRNLIWVKIRADVKVRFEVQANVNLKIFDLIKVEVTAEVNVEVEVKFPSRNLTKLGQS
jgi:hypothetical protein